MAVTTQKLGPGTLQIGEVGTAIDVECQVLSATLTPEVDEEDSETTLCGDEVTGETTVAWTLEGELFQDWSMDGINKFSIDHAGQELPFTYTPNTAAGLAAAGTLKMRPLPIGGETKQKLKADFEWPVVGQPNFTGWTVDAP